VTFFLIRLQLISCVLKLEWMLTTA